MRIRFVQVLAMGAVMAVAQSGYSAGFALFEGSARGDGMGGAVVGLADDPSAIFYNPAGITQLEGFEVMAGATLIRPSTEITTLTPAGEVTTSCIERDWVPPYAYATYQMNNRVWLGFGTYSRFGLGTAFDENWPGRYNNYNAVIKTLTLNPNVAFKVTDKFSLAAGGSAMWFDLKLQRKVPNPLTGQDIDFTLKGDSWGYGYNVAARYEVTKWMALGLAYQSEIKQSVEGSADIQVSSSDASGDVTLPAMVFSGIAFKPIEQLKLEIGAVYSQWSSYDELAITVDNPERIGMSSRESVSPKDWKDVWRYQAGVEYSFNKYVDLRLSYVFDETPDPDDKVDYIVPANDRDIFGIGTGLHWKDWTLDVSYNYLIIRDRDVDARPQQGIYQSEFRHGHAHMVGASLSTKI
jgi:long-chain fatty acid transport protein